MKHTESNAIQSLNRKHDVRIDGKDIMCLSRKSNRRIDDLGNGSWGRIDYLVNYCGYRQIFVNNF